MALGYIKVWLNWTERTCKLKAAEKGRLIDALTLYARGEDVTELLSGNEQFVFPMFQDEIDRDRETYKALSAKRAEAGRAGGNQRQANASKCKQDEANASKASSNSKEYIVGVKENSKEIDDDGGDRAREEQDPVFGYALTELGHLSPTAMEEMSMYRAELPDDLIRWAIDETTSNGTRKWSYTRAILENLTKHGIKTIGEAKAAQDARRQRKGGGKGRDTLTSEKVYEDNLAEVFGV